MNLPHHAHIEPTTLCDLKCVSCVNQTIPKERRGHLSLDRLRYIVEENDFIRDISLVGLGEPMLNPQIVDMSLYLSGMGIKSRTATNGMTLHLVDLEPFLASIDELVISFDSADRDTFEAIRRGADFGRVTENIRRVIALKAEKGLSTIISTQTVISRNNVDSLADLFPMAKSLGVDRLRFSAATQYLSIAGRSVSKEEREEWSRIASIKVAETGHLFEKELRDSLNSLSERYSIPFSLAGFSPRYKDCWWPKGGIFITWDGYVTPCCMRMDPQILNFGNLFETPLANILKGEGYLSFISIYDSGKCPDICRDCP